MLAKWLSIAASGCSSSLFGELYQSPYVEELFYSKVNPIIIHLITFTLVFSDNTVKKEGITVNEKVSD